MTRIKTASFTIVVATIALLAGCLQKDSGDDVTYGEAKEGVDETVATTSAELTLDGTVEISTNFTLGQAAEAAAVELSEWAKSQIPCSTVSLEGATVSIDFGTLNDTCVYNGKTWAGVVKISIKSAEAKTVEVGHEWIGLTNGTAVVNGTATVTWSGSAQSRRVVHEATWTFKNKSFTGSADRTQTLLDPSQGLAGGIEVNGMRSWQGANGQWTLDIDGVQMRPQDPVPQSGSYTLTNPAGKSLAMSFERKDADTIQVTVGTGKHSFSFNVTAIGSVSDS